MPQQRRPADNGPGKTRLAERPKPAVTLDDLQLAPQHGPPLATIPQKRAAPSVVLDRARELIGRRNAVASLPVPVPTFTSEQGGAPVVVPGRDKSNLAIIQQEIEEALAKGNPSSPDATALLKIVRDHHAPFAGLLVAADNAIAAARAALGKETATRSEQQIGAELAALENERQARARELAIRAEQQARLAASAPKRCPIFALCMAAGLSIEGCVFR